MATYKHLVDDLTGRSTLINYSFQLMRQRRFVPKELVCIGGESRNLKHIGFDPLLNGMTAGSINFSLKDAVYGALGEYIERVSSGLISDERTVYGSYNNLVSSGLNFMDPEQLSLFAPWQYQQTKFPFQKLTREDEILWIKGENYFSGEETFIPCALATLAHLPDEKRFMIQASTGQGAGADLPDAIKSGFFEAIERHCWCNLWFNQNERDFITYDPKIILEHYPCDKIKTLFDNKNVSIKAFDLGKNSPVECVVVFLFFICNNKSYYSLGAAARFDKKDAIIKACTEAYQGVDFAIKVDEDSDWDDDYEKILPTITDFKDNFRFYNFYRHLRGECPLFLEAQSNTPSVNCIQVFDNKIKSMDRDEIRTKSGVSSMYCVDLTREEWTLPFHVAKMIVPDWALMSPYYNYPFLGNKIFTNKPDLFLKLPHCFP